MKKLNIEISKAQLQSFSAEFSDDGDLDVRATISLLTSGGKKITEYTISTQSWCSDNKFDLPQKRRSHHRYS